LYKCLSVNLLYFKGYLVNNSPLSRGTVFLTNPVDVAIARRLIQSHNLGLPIMDVCRNLQGERKTELIIKNFYEQNLIRDPKFRLNAPLPWCGFACRQVTNYLWTTTFQTCSKIKYFVRSTVESP
jgi:hypothetical protein